MDDCYEGRVRLNGSKPSLEIGSFAMCASPLATSGLEGQRREDGSVDNYKDVLWGEVIPRENL